MAPPSSSGSSDEAEITDKDSPVLVPTGNPPSDEVLDLTLSGVIQLCSSWPRPGSAEDDSAPKPDGEANTTREQDTNPAATTAPPQQQPARRRSIAALDREIQKCVGDAHAADAAAVTVRLRLRPGRAAALQVYRGEELQLDTTIAEPAFDVRVNRKGAGGSSGVGAVSIVLPRPERSAGGAARPLGSARRGSWLQTAACVFLLVCWPIWALLASWMLAWARRTAMDLQRELDEAKEELGVLRGKQGCRLF